MKPKKKQPVMARKMWGAPPVGADSLKLYNFPISTRPDEKPVFVLPATCEAYDAYVEQMAKALTYTSAIEDGEREEYATAMMKKNWRNGIPDVEAALKSIGIAKPASDAGREEGK